jgi:hypothetical protein
MPLFQSIKWLTDDSEHRPLIERIYRVYNNINDDTYCKHCSSIKTKFDKFTTGYRDFCSISCSTSYNTPSKYWTEETKLLRSKKISDSRKFIKMTDEWRSKLKLAANLDSVKYKKQETCLLKYGCKNPGVLAAYSSKAATNYIIRLLMDRNIDLNRTMFKYENRKEFWQMINVPFLKKQRYFSYDLIVFSTVESAMQKDLSNIELVFEYNGPWHYKKADIIGSEDLPATPYKSNKFTRLQQIELDRLKLEHITKFSPKEILIYWEKINLLDCIPVN